MLNLKRSDCVSIIIPVKNEERRIVECLLNLTFAIEKYEKPVEIIVVDNGSTDSTVEKAKKFNAKVFVLPGASISALRNYGVGHASGSICAFIDSDILVSKDWLCMGMKYFSGENKSNIACVGASPYLADHASWAAKAMHLVVECRGSFSLKRQWIASMNMFVRKDVFQSLGGFNEKLTTAEDVDFGYRLTKKYVIVYDRNIKVVHLGEPAGLFELFQKERWRSTSNYSGVFSHGIVVSELPSLLMPVWTLIILCFVPFAVVWVPKFAVMLLSLLILPSMLVTIVVIGKLRKYDETPFFFIVYFVYLLAKTIAIIDVVLSKGKNAVRRT